MKHESIHDPAYRAFVQHAVQRGTVHSLQDDELYFAECPSESYYNDLGEPEAVYCFWDTAAAAESCRKEEWQHYDLIEINLADFMYENLIDMDRDHHLVGVQFDAELFGMEVEPIELLGDLLDEIQRCGLADTFSEFEELQKYRHEWEQLAWQQQVIH